MIQGMTDVVMKDVNLTTNAGKITLEKVSAWGVRANATAGGVNATLVSASDFEIVARADVVYGNLLPTRGVEVGEVTLDYIDLEKWTTANLRTEYNKNG